MPLSLVKSGKMLAEKLCATPYFCVYEHQMQKIEKLLEAQPFFRVFPKASQQAVFPFLQAIMTCLLLTVNSKTVNLKNIFIFTNTRRRKISEIICFTTFFNCIKQSKNVRFFVPSNIGQIPKITKTNALYHLDKYSKIAKRTNSGVTKIIDLAFAQYSIFC